MEVAEIQGVEVQTMGVEVEVVTKLAVAVEVLTTAVEEAGEVVVAVVVEAID